MHLNPDKTKYLSYFCNIFLFLNLVVFESIIAVEKPEPEIEGIFLPFPDFKEVVPENKEIKSNLIKPDDSPKNTKLLSLEKPKEMKSDISLTTKESNILPNTENATNSKIKSSMNSKANSKEPKSRNKYSKSPNNLLENSKPSNKSKSNQLTSSPEAKSSNDKNLESGLVIDMDLAEFNKSIEKIRSIETKDPEKAIQDYKVLLTKYTNAPILAQLNLYIAWNFFHRNKNSECLEHVVAILDDPENLDLHEYPTALYLAGRVHERNWKGSNRDFAVRYYEIFLQNYKSGKENFIKSFYYPKVQEQLKSLKSNSI